MHSRRESKFGVKGEDSWPVCCPEFHIGSSGPSAAMEVSEQDQIVSMPFRVESLRFGNISFLCAVLPAQAASDSSCLPLQLQGQLVISSRRTPRS